jgi:hypothetical protein
VLTPTDISSLFIYKVIFQYTRIIIEIITDGIQNTKFIKSQPAFYNMNLPFKDVFRFKKNSKFKNVYDTEISVVPEFSKCSSVECHVVLYPYSRKLTRNNYSINPFEEYTKDIKDNQKSAYHKIRKIGKEVFGLLLGACILLFVFEYEASALISVQEIVSVFAAYFIGKDLWDDLEDLMIRISKSWRIRWQSNYYTYQLDRNSTMTQYSRFAKKNRYGMDALLPEKMEFIEEHNSSTVRMYFDSEDLIGSGENVHLLSLHIDQGLVADFEKGHLLGVKLTLNKSFLFINYGLDVFQSISKGRRGCLNEDRKWLDDTIFYRKTLSIGRIKIFLSKGYISDKKIIS